MDSFKKNCNQQEAKRRDGLNSGFGRALFVPIVKKRKIREKRKLSETESI